MKLLARIKKALRLLLLALAGWLARQAADKTLRDLLPQVFDRLDTELRAELRTGGFVPVDVLISRSIHATTGKAPTVDQVKAVAQLFNPIRLGEPR